MHLEKQLAHATITPASHLLVSADAELARAMRSHEVGKLDQAAQHFGAAWVAATLTYDDADRGLGDDILIVETQRRIALFIIQDWAPSTLRFGSSANARLEAFRLAFHVIDWLESSYRELDEKGIGEPEIFANARQRVYAMMVAGSEVPATSPAKHEVN